VRATQRIVMVGEKARMGWIQLRRMVGGRGELRVTKNELASSRKVRMVRPTQQVPATISNSQVRCSRRNWSSDT